MSLVLSPTPRRHMAIEPFLTPKELCLRWKITKGAVSQMVSDGRLKAMRIGRSVRIRESDVVRFEKLNYGRVA